MPVGVGGLGPSANEARKDDARGWAAYEVMAGCCQRRIRVSTLLYTPVTLPPPLASPDRSTRCSPAKAQRPRRLNHRSPPAS